jgi:hypothetical protein
LTNSNEPAAKNRLIVIFFILVSIVFSAVSPIKLIINFTHDDAYFYIKIADNISMGIGSTFDGINTTNGYHPLWLIIITALYFIVHLFGNVGPEVILRVTAFFHLLMGIATGILLLKIYRIVYKENFISQKLILLLIISFIFVFTRDWGLESNLSCLVLTLLLYIKTLEFQNHQNLIKTKTLLFCLIIFVRIDYTFTIIPFLIFADFITSDINRRYRNFITISSSVMLVTLFYYLYNYFFYGHYLPISSFLLSSVPPKIILFNSIRTLLLPEYYLNHDIKIILLLFVVIAFPLIMKNRWSKLIRAGKNQPAANDTDNDEQLQVKYSFFIWGMGAGFLSLVIFYVVFISAPREWYMTAPAFSAALLFVRLVDNYKRLTRYFLILFLILGTGYFYVTRIYNSVYGNSYDFALQLKDVLPEGSRILQGNKSGIVGFFSERQIVNGDGLVNSFEYYELIKDGKLEEYIKQKNIKYYCTFTGAFESDTSQYFTDNLHSTSEKIKMLTLVFPRKNLIFTYPHFTQHIAGKTYGEWHIFKFED